MPRPFGSATSAGLNRSQTISLLDKPPPDDGLAGAKLAISDNNTTGRFIEPAVRTYRMRRCAPTTIPWPRSRRLAERGIVLILTDVPADRLLTLADAGRGKGVDAVQHPGARTTRCASRIVATM